MTNLLRTTIAAQYTYALVHKGDQPQLVAGKPWERVRFEVVASDEAGLWDATGNQFVVPEGVNLVRLTGQIVFSHGERGARQVLITKNSALFDCYPAQNGAAFKGTTPDMNVSSPPLKVKQGDTFQLHAWAVKSRWAKRPAEIYGNGGTWFSMEVLA